MSQTIQLRRRAFLTAALAAGGALSLNWNAAAQGAAQGAELGIWVVIQPDDTTIVRIARSEMGQGTLTGLAQLVADELDADWRFVKAEYVAPEVNLVNKRAWGDMSTGGSRGIRASVDYVRKGGDPTNAGDRKCLCNGLLATVGLGQVRTGVLEPPIVTAGDDIASISRFLKPGEMSYSADDVLNDLLGAEDRQSANV